MRFKKKLFCNLLLISFLLISMVERTEVWADDASIAYGGSAVGIRNNTEYYSMNCSSERFLSLETTSDENLSNVYTRPRSETTMSQWRTELQSDGTYQLVSVYNPSSKVLDVTSGNVDIYIDNGGSYLKFNIQRIATGAYKGLYYITQGDSYVTEDTGYNVIMS